MNNAIESGIISADQMMLEINKAPTAHSLLIDNNAKQTPTMISTTQMMRRMEEKAQQSTLVA